MSRAKRQMLIGGAFLVLGWLTSLLIVIEVLPAFIWLNLAAYSLIVVGFMVGMIGVFTQARINIDRHKRDNE